LPAAAQPTLAAADEGFTVAADTLVYTGGMAAEALNVPYNCGRPVAASTRAERFAVATADAWIRVYDPDGASYKLSAALPVAARGLGLSPDGNSLLAWGDSFVRGYALPAGSQTFEWAPEHGASLFDVVFAESGDRFATLTCTGTVNCKRTVRSVTDGSTVFETSSPGPSVQGSLGPFVTAVFTPSGRRIAFDASSRTGPTRDTVVADDAAIVGQANDAYPVLWLSEGELAVARLAIEIAGARVTGYAVVNEFGAELRKVVLPPSYWLTMLRQLDSGVIYASLGNAVYSLVDGSLLWSWSTPQSQWQTPATTQPQGLSVGLNVVLATHQGQVLYRRWR
jgi:hypothetical protein